MFAESDTFLTPESYKEAKTEKPIEYRNLDYIMSTTTTTNEETSSGSTPGLSDQEFEEFLSNDAFNHFEIVKNIGKGAYGNVYKTKSKTDKKLYALKIIPLLSDQDEEKMNREVEVLSKLQHTHIVRYHTSWYLNNNGKISKFDDDFKCLCIQMEYCDQTLRDFIDNMSFIESKEERVSEQTRIVMEILDGVRYVHDQNVMHRDLNPKNIFLTKSGTVKIGDFGIARLSELTSVEKATPSRAIDEKLTSYIGTKLYCCPEITNGDKNYDKRIDLYSLGVIIFEIWYPFPSNTTDMEKSKVFGGIKSVDVIIPESFEPEPIKEIIIGLLQHDPNNRMSLEAVYEKLAAIENDEPCLEERRDLAGIGTELSAMFNTVGRMYYGKKIIMKGCCVRLGAGPYVLTCNSIVEKKHFPKFWSLSFGSKYRNKADFIQLKQTDNPVWASTILNIAILEIDRNAEEKLSSGLEMQNLDVNQKLCTLRNLKSTKRVIEITDKTLFPDDPTEDIVMDFGSVTANKGAPVLYLSDESTFSLFGIIVGHLYENGIKVKDRTIVRNVRSVYESIEPIVPVHIRTVLFSSSPFFKCHERLMQNIESFITCHVSE